MGQIWIIKTKVTIGISGPKNADMYDIVSVGEHDKDDISILEGKEIVPLGQAKKMHEILRTKRENK